MDRELQDIAEAMDPEGEEALALDQDMYWHYLTTPAADSDDQFELDLEWFDAMGRD